jgi:hypothetical protein
VKIVRSAHSVDLRNVPIDGFDMFLLSRLDLPLSLVDLAEMAPCDPTVTMERIYHLAQLGLVEIRPDDDAERPLRPRSLPAVPPRPVHRPVLVADDAQTLRPPPRTSSLDDAVTLRPPAPSTPFDAAPSTGVRTRLAAFAPAKARTRR